MQVKTANVNGGFGPSGGTDTIILHFTKVGLTVGIGGNENIFETSRRWSSLRSKSSTKTKEALDPKDQKRQCGKRMI